MSTARGAWIRSAVFLIWAVLPGTGARAEDACDIPRRTKDCVEIQAELNQLARKGALRPDQIAARNLAVQCIEAAKGQASLEGRIKMRRLQRRTLKAMEKVRKQDAALAAQQGRPRPAVAPPPEKALVRNFGVTKAKTVADLDLMATTADFDALPAAERLKIRILADAISRSFDFGGFPIRQVNIVGHADSDPRGKAFEQKVSEKRATVAKIVLLDKLGQLTLPLIVRQVRVSTEGKGATEPAPENKGKNASRLTEAQRKLNRRVEFTAIHSLPQVPPDTITPPVVVTKEPRPFDYQAAAKAAGRAVAAEWNREVQCIKRSHFPPAVKPTRGDPLKQLMKEIKCHFDFVDAQTVFNMIHDAISPPEQKDFDDNWTQLEAARRARQNNPRPDPDPDPDDAGEPGC